MTDQIRSAIERHGLIPPGAHVLVAVSGGADSVALLHLLAALQTELRLTLTVAHLHHSLRGPAADADAAFVQALAGRLGLPCVLERADVRAAARARGLSVEMAGRDLRYAFLARAARAVGATHIATAHHADDQAETLLLRLLRGAGPRGLGGIEPASAREGLRIVRPLLDLAHGDLVDFLRARSLAWREDASNADTALLRNRVRHELLPLLEKRYQPAIRANLLRTAEVLRAEQAWMDAYARRALRRCAGPGGALRPAPLLRLPLAARRRVLLSWLASGGVPAEGLDLALLERVSAWAAGASARISLPGSLVLARRSAGLVLRPDAAPVPPPAFHLVLPVPGCAARADLGLRLKAAWDTGFTRPSPARPGPGRFVAHVDAARLAGATLIVRSRKPGDRMRPHGLRGSVKLQDVLVDLKVPAVERDRVPVFVCGDEILWVPGYRIARGWAVPSPHAPSVRLEAVVRTGGQGVAIP